MSETTAEPVESTDSTDAGFDSGFESGDAWEAPDDPTNESGEVTEAELVDEDGNPIDQEENTDGRQIEPRPMNAWEWASDQPHGWSGTQGDAPPAGSQEKPDLRPDQPSNVGVGVGGKGGAFSGGSKSWRPRKPKKIAEGGGSGGGRGGGGLHIHLPGSHVSVRMGGGAKTTTVGGVVLPPAKGGRPRSASMRGKRK